MARVFNGSTQSVDLASAPISNFPMSFACWFNVTNVTADHTLICIGDTAGDDDYLRLAAAGNVAGDPVRWQVRRSGIFSLDTTAGFTANVWYHALGVSAASNDHRVYLNGGSKGTSLTGATFPLGVDASAIGRLIRASPTLYTAGSLAMVAIWDVGLDDGDALTLAAGVSPLRVKPGNLVTYVPLIGVDGEIDAATGVAWTLTNAPTIGAGPAVQPPFGIGRRRLIPVTMAAGVSAAVTGTATASITEADVVTGGKTIILTLTGDTYIAADTGPIGTTANSEALIDGIDSAQAEAAGWDAEVKAAIKADLATYLVRTSDTVATITLPAVAAYDITAQETITVTIPAAVLTGAAPIVAAPTFTVDPVVTGIPAAVLAALMEDDDL